VALSLAVARPRLWRLWRLCSSCSGCSGCGGRVQQPQRPWAGLGWAGLGWAGLGWAGLGWAGLQQHAARGCRLPATSALRSSLMPASCNPTPARAATSRARISGDHGLPGGGQDDPGQLRAQRGNAVSKYYCSKLAGKRASKFAGVSPRALSVLNSTLSLKPTRSSTLTLPTPPHLLTGPRQKDLRHPNLNPSPSPNPNPTRTLTGPRQEDLRHRE